MTDIDFIDIKRFDPNSLEKMGIEKTKDYKIRIGFTNEVWTSKDYSKLKKIINYLKKNAKTYHIIFE